MRSSAFWGISAPYKNRATGSSTVEYLIVAGGGAGGWNTGGGGGAGGVVTGTIANPSGTYNVTVGLGGVPNSTNGTNGGDSIFHTYSATGGGYGGAESPSIVGGNAGGSGGGAGYRGSPSQGGAGITGQGYAGGGGSSGSYPYTNGGGGGAGGPGQNANVGGNKGGNGGAGILSSITGNYYAGGGGGGGYAAASAPAGTASNGGGAGGGGSSPAGVGGTTNTGGGGGGGAAGGSGTGGSGGSGVVVLKYSEIFTITISGGLTGSTTSPTGGYKITTITAGTGTVSWSGGSVATTWIDLVTSGAYSTGLLFATDFSAITSNNGKTLVNGSSVTLASASSGVTNTVVNASIGGQTITNMPTLETTGSSGSYITTNWTPNWSGISRVSISVLVFVPSVNGQYMPWSFLKAASSSEGISMWHSSSVHGRFVANSWDGDSNLFNPTLLGTPGNWEHHVWVIQPGGGVTKAYRNGVLHGSSNSSLPAYGTVFTIGNGHAASGSNSYNATGNRFAMYGIWNYELTSTQISSLYNSIIACRYATPTSVSGQESFTTPGTYSFVVPTGVTTISAIAVGGGGGGDGDSGGLAGSGGCGGGVVYSNNWSVTPGESLTVTVGNGVSGGSGSSSASGTGGSSTISRGGSVLISAYGGSSGSSGGGSGTYSVGTGMVIQGGSKGSGEGQSGQSCGSSPRCGINGYYGDPGGGGTAIVSGATGSDGAAAGSNSGGSGGQYGGGGGTGNGQGGGAGASGAVRFAWGSSRTYPSNAPNV